MKRPRPRLSPPTRPAPLLPGPCRPAEGAEEAEDPTDAADGAQALWALRKDESGEEDLVLTSERGVRLDHFKPAWPRLEARRASGACRDGASSTRQGDNTVTTRPTETGRDRDQAGGRESGSESRNVSSYFG